ncbi:MAG: hypothetical protein ACFE95_00220 [Candidatus Hodarchaeota archaeon]
MQLAAKVLEDKSTLLQIRMESPESPNALRAPVAHLISIFAVQPSADLMDAAKHLHRVVNHPGIQLVRQIFPVQRKNTKQSDRDNSYIGLLLLVRVTMKFPVRSDRTLPLTVKEARKKFVKQRSIAYSILEASGCKITLVTGNDLVKVNLHGKKIAEGITVFKGLKGFHSKLVETFLRLDRVPSRVIQEYPGPKLSVKYRVGTRVDNSVIPVGFSKLTNGTLLVSGSHNPEVISVLQQLIGSLTESGPIKPIFIIDTHNELNGLIKTLQRKSLQDINLQVFRLGVNIHLNLCDVVTPLLSSEKKKEVEARAAWKAHLISQIILSSLHTSEYLIDRYAIPLETQLKKTAEKNYLFTLQDVKFNVGSDVEENTDGTGMIFADMATIDALVGIIDQFQSFPEINYSAFTGHYANTMIREGTVTFFQFGAQPPLVRRATIGFLLQYLSQTIKEGCVVLTHVPEFLGQKTIRHTQRELTASFTVESCQTIAQHNLMILGSNSLQNLAMIMDNFEEIQNRIYLQMVNPQDREIILNHHELPLDQETSSSSSKYSRYTKYSRQKSLGIVRGEGLLFREDVPKHIGFHFRVESKYPIDQKPVAVYETKLRGSETLGLTPEKYKILMKLLKLLNSQACRADEAIALIAQTKRSEIALEQFKSLGMYDEDLHQGTRYWIITSKGRDFYQKQHDFIRTLDAPLPRDKIGVASQELKRLESFYDITASRSEKQDTNTKVKYLLGSVLNYLIHLRASVPWLRVAEYYDLAMIDSLEWQDFRHLFDGAHSLLNNLLLEIKQLHKQQSEEEIQRTIETTSIQPHSEKKVLDDFLPDETSLILQQMSQEVELPPYPNTGILDLYYTLHKKQRSLFDELTVKRREKH